jgi:small subunit ribosomal protein S1
VDAARQQPGDLYQKGDDVEAVILSINHDEKKVSLGIKQLFEPWATCSRASWAA